MPEPKMSTGASAPANAAPGGFAPSTCPVCAPVAPPTLEVAVDGSHRVVECTGCGLVRVAALPGPGWVESTVTSEGYGVRHAGEIDFRRTYTLAELAPTRAFVNARATHRDLVDLLRAAGVDPAARLRAHDIGCSEGLAIHFAREQGWEADGNDLSAHRRDFGRRSLGIDFFLGYFADAPIAPASLDVVTVRHVLEHLPDPVAELERIRDRLRPGGILVVECPNFENPALRLKLWRQRHGLRRQRLDFIGVPEHCWQFTARTLRLLLEKAGFAVRVSRTTSAFANHGPLAHAVYGATLHRAGLGAYLLVAAARS